MPGSAHPPRDVYFSKVLLVRSRNPALDIPLALACSGVSLCRESSLCSSGGLDSQCLGICSPALSWGSALIPSSLCSCTALHPNTEISHSAVSHPGVPSLYSEPGPQIPSFSHGFFPIFPLFPFFLAFSSVHCLPHNSEIKLPASHCSLLAPRAHKSALNHYIFLVFLTSSEIDFLAMTQFPLHPPSHSLSLTEASVCIWRVLLWPETLWIIFILELECPVLLLQRPQVSPAPLGCAISCQVVRAVLKFCHFLPSVKPLFPPPVSFQGKMPFISTLLPYPKPAPPLPVPHTHFIKRNHFIERFFPSKKSLFFWRKPFFFGRKIPSPQDSGRSTFICIFPYVPTCQGFSVLRSWLSCAQGRISVGDELPTSAPSPQSLLGGKLG